MQWSKYIAFNGIYERAWILNIRNNNSLKMCHRCTRSDYIVYELKESKQISHTEENSNFSLGHNERQFKKKKEHNGWNEKKKQNISTTKIYKTKSHRMRDKFIKWICVCVCIGYKHNSIIKCLQSKSIEHKLYGKPYSVIGT